MISYSKKKAKENITLENNIDYDLLTKKISRFIKINIITNILLLSIFTIFTPIGIILFTLTIFIKIISLIKLRININYDLNDKKIIHFQKQYDALLLLRKNDRYWQVFKNGKINDIKRNGGASIKILRQNFKTIIYPPFYLKTNLNLFHIKCKKQSLIFIPNRIILIQGWTVTSFDINSLVIEFGDVLFLEPALVFNDVQIVDYSWLFTNIDGSRDKRFKTNARLPICHYGLINFKINNKLYLSIYCSSISKTQICFTNINKVFKTKILNASNILKTC